MKKSITILISIITIALFAGLVNYGVRHSRGVPTAIEEKKLVLLEVPFIEKDIDLSKGIARDVWETLPSREVELMYQLMALPWGKSLIPAVFVKAFHNKRDIYFYIEWNDSTEDVKVERNIFPDACAIMFPMDDKAQPSTLMMGFLGGANIWHWKASQDREYWLKESPQTKAYSDFHYPFEEKELFPVSKETPVSAVTDLMAVRVGTITKKNVQRLEGRGFWNDGTRRVVIKRAIRALDPETDAVFNAGGPKRLCAFAVWNGAAGDRGGRKSISDWVELKIE